MNRGCACLIGLRSVEIFEIGWKMKMRKRFSAKNDHLWYFWFSNFFKTGIEELYIKIHTDRPKKWLFWPNFQGHFATQFLNRFQKFQRIWDLWRKEFFHTKLKKFFLRFDSPYCTQTRVMTLTDSISFIYWHEMKK